MNNVPEKIYLQIDADGETPEDFAGLEVTWCSDRINENDIAYVREPSTEQSGGTEQEELKRDLQDVLEHYQHYYKGGQMADLLLKRIKQYYNVTRKP